MYECPTTQPMSEVVKIVSFFCKSNPSSMLRLTPTAVPPWSRTIPFGTPVVPEVYNIYNGSVELRIVAF
jgi:hypothetical protein